MTYQSKIVETNQDGVHPRLLDTLERHQQRPWQKPYRAHNQQAFEQLKAFLQEQDKRTTILDSGCGTGQSTVTLSGQNPGCSVIGVDQSEARLGRCEGGEANNALLLRANCEDLWRLCVDEGIFFQQHYLLYPNPWPKSVHLQRRWHGHPVFSYLPKLAPVTVLRSNWLLYLQEFAVAWAHITGKVAKPRCLSDTEACDTPLTLFEAKYARSGQAVYELIVES